MTGLADRLADRTGLGEALVGGVLLGAATSLSGTVVSLTAALDGRASLAFSNGIGGIAAQTAFLALADLIYRKANLEHAAADLANVFQGTVLMLLLTLPLLALTAPPVTVAGMHPVSVVIVLVYIVGLRASHEVRQAPMWMPVRTDATRPDTAEDAAPDGRSTPALVSRFGALMLVMGLAGWGIAKTTGVAIDRFGLSASVAGALVTAVITSLPELVTTLVAIRQGALQLAIGGIIGGNTFDTLFLTLSDAGYRDGSIYHAVGQQDVFWLVIGLLLTVILVIGQLFRQRHGPAGIGLESLAVLAVYVGAVVLQATLPDPG